MAVLSSALMIVVATLVAKMIVTHVALVVVTPVANHVVSPVAIRIVMLIAMAVAYQMHHKEMGLEEPKKNPDLHFRILDQIQYLARKLLNFENILTKLTCESSSPKRSGCC